MALISQKETKKFDREEEALRCEENDLFAAISLFQCDQIPTDE